MLSALSSVAASSGLKLSGTTKSSSGQFSVETIASGGPAAPGGSGISENFRTAILNRALRLQNSGQLKNSGPGEARALADSLSLAAAQVKEVYGQEGANTFMAKVLTEVDQGGFSAESLAASVGSALKYVAQTGNKSQLKSITENFNRDLGVDHEQGREVKSLSRGLNDFFGLDQAEKGHRLFTQGFDDKGNWGEVEVKNMEEGDSFITGTPEAAVNALADSASFTFETLGTEVKDNLVNFLRQEAGAGEAADFLESAPETADFMSTLDKTIDLALKERPEAAASLEAYLNDGVKSAINASTTINQNPFGEVAFEGWNLNLSQADGDEGKEGSRTFYSSWRYLNREDAVYVRGGESPANTVGKDNQKVADQTDGDGSLTDLIGRVAYGEKNSPGGELVDTTV